MSWQTRRRCRDTTLNSELSTLHQRLGVPRDYALSRGLKRHPEPQLTDLVSVSHATSREILLVSGAAAAWRQMEAAALSQSVCILPLSGFRSIVRQTEIFEAKLARGLTIDEILAVNAAPGYSEHHTGRALDVATPDHPRLEESFGATAAYQWLAGHAGEFGFKLSYPRNNPHGIAFEPWHWCWHG